MKEELGRLHTQIRDCRLCKLADTRTHAVPGEGIVPSLVMFVGEGPGRDEDHQGRPFVGRSGQFLSAMLSQQGIALESVFITNVVKCRPPENRDPEADELQACSAYLDRQIALIDPHIIVTLGRFSMQRWFPGAAITKVHGQVKEIGMRRIAIPLFHPAAALRNPAWRKAFEADMAKLPPLIEAARLAKRGC